jgi:hypothetical protein
MVAVVNNTRESDNPWEGNRFSLDSKCSSV